MQEEKHECWEDMINDIVSALILMVNDRQPLPPGKKYSYSLSFEFGVSKNGVVHDIGTTARVKCKEIIIN